MIKESPGMFYDGMCEYSSSLRKSTCVKLEFIDKSLHTKAILLKRTVCIIRYISVFLMLLKILKILIVKLQCEVYYTIY